MIGTGYRPWPVMSAVLQRLIDPAETLAIREINGGAGENEYPAGTHG
ncbi:hypothetical protein [Paraburkholderia sp. Ac-20347]|nr:hypothetical protein [Paraburkholderia sp. Ac-20347]MBN3813745.1 hypothetical protein [Paraburkholderia sp. Ac-20347]